MCCAQNHIFTVSHRQIFLQTNRSPILLHVTVKQTWSIQYAWGSWPYTSPAALECWLCDGKVPHSIRMRDLLPSKIEKQNKKRLRCVLAMILLSPILLQTVLHAGFHLQSPWLALCRLQHPAVIQVGNGIRLPPTIVQRRYLAVIQCNYKDSRGDNWVLPKITTSG